MRKKLIAAFSVAGVLLAALVIYFSTATDAALPEAEVAEMLEDRYNGQVEDIRSGQHENRLVYHTEIATAEGLYYVMVDAVSGMIEDIELLTLNENRDREQQLLSAEEINSIVLESAGENAVITEVEQAEREGRTIFRVTVEQDEGTGTFQLDGFTGEVLLYTLEAREEESPAGPISRQQAIDIALEEFPGEVDDVDLEQQGGRLVYEIEIENDETDVEAVIIIDAYTGEILSVELD